MNKKAIESFLGIINFLRKFISDYTQRVKPLQEMIKKDAINKWDKKEKDAFSHLKQVTTKAPSLYNPNYNKDLLLYTFTYDTSIVSILT